MTPGPRFLVPLMLLVCTAPLRTDAKTAPLPPDYVEECGSCHVAFPGRMLGAASWDAVLVGLADHFGVDASSDPETLAPIRAYLAASARRRPTRSPEGAPELRITDTRWFRHEHDEVPKRLRTGSGAVNLVDCGVCHREAAAGSYAERSLRLPPKGEAK